MKIDWIVGWISPNLYELGDNIKRYRDNFSLLFCLRSIQKYAPWINKIHIILGRNSNPPFWLKEDEKINLVKETSLYKNIQKNSETKKLFYHLIPNLSEYFITSDDDMFLISKLNKDSLFYRGKPILNTTGFSCESGGESDGIGHIPLFWKKIDYGRAVKNIDYTFFITMGKKRYNPWPYMKEYLLKKTLVVKGNITKPHIYINQTSRFKYLDKYLIEFLMKKILYNDNQILFMNINDDFSLNKKKYVSQINFFLKVMCLIFDKKENWENNNFNFNLDNLSLKINCGKSNKSNNKIMKIFNLSNKYNYEFKNINLIENNFEFKLINNRLLIKSDKDWNKDLIIELKILFNLQTNKHIQSEK